MLRHQKCAHRSSANTLSVCCANPNCIQPSARCACPWPGQMLTTVNVYSRSHGLAPHPPSCVAACCQGTHLDGVGACAARPVYVGGLNVLRLPWVHLINRIPRLRPHPVPALRRGLMSGPARRSAPLERGYTLRGRSVCCDIRNVHTARTRIHFLCAAPAQNVFNPQRRAHFHGRAKCLPP